MNNANDSKNNRPITEEDCKKLYEMCKTPQNVIGHCREVGRVAGGLAARLNMAGYNFDENLCVMAGNVHDIMRTSENHGEEGAKVLVKCGFNREADLVRNHMHYDFNDIEHLTEMDLLCLADRMVEDDKYVGFEKRMDSLIKRRNFSPEKAAVFQAKKEDTKQFINKLEEKIGEPLDNLFLRDKQK